jgi:hypothetical protein
MENQDVTVVRGQQAQLAPRDAMVIMEKRGTLGPKEKLGQWVVMEKKETLVQLDPRAIWDPGDTMDALVKKVSEVTLDQRVTQVPLDHKVYLAYLDPPDSKAYRDPLEHKAYLAYLEQRVTQVPLDNKVYLAPLDNREHKDLQANRALLVQKAMWALKARLEFRIVVAFNI